MMQPTPSSLHDDDLVAEVKRLAGCAREMTAQLVAHLAELDVRRLYLGAGYSSLFAYCCQVLRLSEHGSYNRIEAARTARRFPAVVEMLGDGRLTLATLRLLAPQLTEHNHQELLGAASRLSKREVEDLIARRFPRPDVVTTIRKLPAGTLAAGGQSAEGLLVPATAVAVLSASGASVTVPFAATGARLASTAASPTQPARPAIVAPLSADRYQIKFTASAEMLARLRQAQDLLRHAVPSGDAAEIIDRALMVLVADLTRKKCAATARPRPPRGTAAGSRHVPAAVRRAVWMRDGGRCGFIAKAGRRCDERGFLEFHHVSPYAAGGEATADNLELRCRGHNAYEADLFYGPIRLAMGHASSTRPGASWGRPAADGARPREIDRSCALVDRPGSPS